MKIVAANRSEKYKGVEWHDETYIKQEACLVYHQHCAGGNEKAGEYKKIKRFFQQILRILFQNNPLGLHVFAAVTSIVYYRKPNGVITVKI